MTMLVNVMRIELNGLTERTLELEDGATLSDACALLGAAPGEVTLWGERREGAAKLKAGDRLDWADPIVADPKRRRKERAHADGDVRVVTCGRHGGRHVADASRRGR